MIYIIKLTDEQKDIINYEDNMIVSANAGTGKTATLIEKINSEVSKRNSYKIIGAITFTIKATNEIRERLKTNKEKVYINTNNGFVFDEIISPFYKDYDRKGIYLSLSTDYNQNFKTYSEGIELILKKGIIGSYENAKLNFIFELANNIMDSSLACRRYLKSKYKLICIDEYQDTDEEMHKLFMKLKNVLGIKLFIIGDIKQSIYIWRNSKPELFESVINNSEFKVFYLTTNFRSSLSIQNYSNLLLKETQGLLNFNDLENQDVNLIIGNSDAENLLTALKLCDPNKPFALLRYSRSNAKNASNMINSYGIKCSYIPLIPIREITTNSSWIYLGISEYLLVNGVSEYDFFQQIPGGIENDSELKFIKKALKTIKINYEEQDKNLFYENIKKIGNYYDYDISNEHLDLLYESITKEEYINAIQTDLYKNNVSITFHTSKGLQFDQVIIYAEDYNLNNIESIYNHYVASTRAKNKLIIIANSENYNSKQYANNITKLLNENGIKANQIFNIIKK